MARLVAAAVCAGALAAPAAAAPSPAPTTSQQSWAQTQIALVTARGLFAATPASFRPADALTAGTLARVVGVLTGTSTSPPADGAAPVTIAGLDTALVRAVGLGDAAHRFFVAARAAGLRPPTRFGTETVARLIGLRVNHPAAQDALELQPQDVATRAEAAYSAAKALALQPGTVQAVDAASRALALPAVQGPVQEILATAVSLIGYPYVWAGADERTSVGFDCSGFVWRVYKGQSYPDLPGLGATITGRSTMQMSGEVPRAERIPFAALEPGDVLFFGDGPASKPAEIGHAGIYLGGGWFIHAGDEGVALAPLDAGWRAQFAWARRPLAEAGLDPSGG